MNHHKSDTLGELEDEEDKKDKERICINNFLKWYKTLKHKENYALNVTPIYSYPFSIPCSRIYVC